MHPTSQLRTAKTNITLPKYKVIDFHTHLGEMQDGSLEMDYDTAELVAWLQAQGIKKTVNLDFMYDEKRDRVLEKEKGFEDFFLNFGAPDISQFEESDFEKTVYRQISENVESYGMKGIKLWNNIGFMYKDKNGKYIKPDDEHLTCIYELAAEYDIPVLYHIADPVAFFDPIDENNERYAQLRKYPEWSYADPKFCRFEELIESQINLLESFPKTTFVLAHVGSYSENLKQVGQWLDKYQNMYIDISARIDELGRAPYTSRRFFEKYSDRILFGTDYAYGQNPYPEYWRFLETFDEYFNPFGEDPEGLSGWNIYGIGLPDEILKKIYYENAEKLLKLQEVQNGY